MLKPATIDEWQDYYRKTPVTSFFQSPDWSLIWHRHSSGRFQPSPLKAELPSGKIVLLPLTRQRIRGGIGVIWHAAPAGTYGGWLCGPDVVLTADEIKLLLKALFRHCGSLVARPFPLTAVSGGNGVLSSTMDPVFLDKIKQESPGISVTSDRTQLLDCSAGYDSIYAGWSEGKAEIKRKIQKAEREGIHIRLAKDENDRLSYYKLYLDAVRRWDPPPSHVYPASFIDMLTDADGHSANVPDSDSSGKNRCMWLAELEGDIVAGVILLSGNLHSAYWHGVFNPDAGNKRPMNLLLARIIEWCCHNGIHWFDFNPSMGLSGVERFKQSFGARPASSPVIKKTSRRIRAAEMAGTLMRRFRNTGGWR